MDTKLDQENNPFVSSLRIEVSYIQNREVTQEIDGIVYTVKPVEKEGYVCFYADSALDVFLRLSSTGKDLLVYIMHKLNRLKKTNRDYLELDSVQCMERLGISRATFYRAIQELTNVAIIPRKSRRGTYWINPQIFFKGNRLRAYPDNTVSTTSAKEIMERMVEADKEETQRKVLSGLDS